MEQLVARRAHNPKVTGSSPVSATRKALVNDQGFFNSRGMECFLLMLCAHWIENICGHQVINDKTEEINVTP